MTIGILLVNLGTPRSPKEGDVKRYLTEFLTDGRVIDLPYFSRQLLVRGMIVPKRQREVAKLYSEIWEETGSPLLSHGRRLASALEDKLGAEFSVELAMRYQVPSIEAGLEALRERGVEYLVVVPLFPQYASATTGSIHQRVLEIVKGWNVIPPMSFIHQFSTHPAFIRALLTSAAEHDLASYDHFVFSFHGLPERHLMKADNSGCCLKKEGCCDTLRKGNRSCYAANCYATTRALQQALSIPDAMLTVAFQSRLGKDPWVKPHTNEVLDALSRAGVKRVLVFSPAFVADCIETIHEIGIQYREAFLAGGGEELDYVRSLNDRPEWVLALKEIIYENLPMSLTRG